MIIEKIELHDAIIKSAAIDYVAKTMELALDVYLTTNDSVRNPLIIVFDGVEAISKIVDFDCLKKNQFAGNINYWIPSQNGGTTYIYLSDGCIAIKADKIYIKNQD